MNLPRHPLGLRPRSIAVQQRTSEVREAIKRYEAAGLPVPTEWRVELSCLIEQADVRGCAPLEARPEPPTLCVWHRTANRLAPPGVSVQIRDRSGKQVASWAFGGPQKPPFPVKSWRFMYGADARHCARVWAEVDALRKTAGAPAQLEPTERADGRPLESFRETGWTDEQLIRHGYFRRAEPRLTPTGRSVEAVEKAFRESVSKNLRENMSGILAGLKASESR